MACADAVMLLEIPLTLAASALPPHVPYLLKVMGVTRDNLVISFWEETCTQRVNMGVAQIYTRVIRSFMPPCIADRHFNILRSYGYNDCSLNPGLCYRLQPEYVTAIRRYNV